ncbi:MAG: elongation factor G [Gemmataceae bacterium]
MAKTDKVDLSKIRNIGVIAHIDAGKTTTTEHILYYAGATHRLGEVDAGTTEADYDPEEKERGITIYSACVPFQWQGHTINLIDTPGHVDFTAEVERSLRVLDGCVVVFDAQKGVEAQSETVWRQADKYGVPRLVFINKMDIVGANFENALADIRERLQGRPVAITIPIGSGSIKDSPRPFEGVIDLIAMQALYFRPSSADRPDGKTVEFQPIPDDLLAEAQSWREKLFDVLTEVDEEDRITSAYLEGQPIEVTVIRELLRQRTLRNEIQPVLCGSGREHIGVQPLMDAVCWYLPCPLDRPPVTGVNPKKPDKQEKRKPDPNEPFCGLVFKVVADKHGDVFFVRVYSGTLKGQSRVYNPGKEAKELISKLYHIHADPKRGREEVPTAPAGDIVALVGLRDSITGDTLCDPQHPILLEAIKFAEAVVSQSVEPYSSADRDKLLETLNALKREDPTFDWRVDAETGQTLMSGMGVLHLEIKQHRMERDFGLKVRVGKPYVSYRETLRQPRLVQGGVPRLETYVEVYFEPVRSTTAAAPEVVEAGDVAHVPKPLREAALQGVKGSLLSGDLGFPVINVRAEIRGYTLHPELSTEVAVQAAGADAVLKALKDNAVLLEPVMALEVTIPEDYLGPVSADLNARRATITEMHTRGNLRVLEALIPLAKMFDYSDKIRSLTQGRASWTMEPHAYEPAPDEVMRQLFGEAGI